MTFLFTDVEGSTERWERDRAAMQEALQRHDALLRDAIEHNRGYVFKTIGDAFCAVFARVEDAVAAALEAQRSLDAADFASVDGMRVRMALHTGTAQERDDDYFGPTVNRVARLLAVGHGGQVLVSGTATELLRAAMLANVRLRDLGQHRLKDLLLPETVSQLEAEGLRTSFPPLRSIQSQPNNLPFALSSLIGRDDDVAEIKRLVGIHRLVTLAGAGGIGKTRAALQVAAELLGSFADGVWFVELAPIADETLIASTIAAALSVRESRGQRVIETLLEHLKNRRTLIVLDNCEHLIAEAASVSADILRTAPQVRLLATSRQGLGLAGEVEYRLPSLAVPALEAQVTAGNAASYGALALFVERARAADTKFCLTDEGAPIVAEVCRRLDGIALAIELAAARVKVLTIPNLARRLDERFRILTGGDRTALPRQQTMRALIDWSFDLLSEAERTLFRRIGIFSDGWALEAAEAVCADESLDGLDVLDLHASLVEKSLVVAELAGDTGRYRLLESTRAYALEKLDGSGERSLLARRQATWLATFADQMQTALLTTPTDRWLANAAPELENVRAALVWAHGPEGDPVLAGRIAAGLSGLWSLTGRLGEGRRWVEGALAVLRAGEHPEMEAHLWRVLATFNVAKGSVEAAQHAVALSSQSGDRRGLAQGYRLLAMGLWQMQRMPEAEEASDRAIELWRELGQTQSSHYASALDTRALLTRLAGRQDEARALYSEAIDLYRSLGEVVAAAIPAVNLAEMEFAAGDVRRALELADEAAATFARLGVWSGRAKTLANVAAYRVALGELDEARLAAREALELGLKAQDAQIVSAALVTFTALAALRGEATRAAALLGYVDAWYHSVDYERESTEQHSYDLTLASLREQLPADEVAAHTRRGAQLSVAQAADEALKI